MLMDTTPHRTSLSDAVHLELGCMSAQTSVCILSFLQSRKCVFQVEVVGGTGCFQCFAVQALFEGPSPFCEYTMVLASPQSLGCRDLVCSTCAMQ